MPDGMRQLFECLQECVEREDWTAFGQLLADAPARESAELDEDAQANTALVQRYFEMWNTGAGSEADALLDARYVDHAYPDVLGPAASRSLAPRFHAANPDARMVVEAIVAEGEFVTVRNAIHRSRDGGEVVSRGMAFFRIANGKLVEQWSCYPGKRGRKAR
jgi:ketosteroid isomerase-like protein